MLPGMLYYTHACEPTNYDKYTMSCQENILEKEAITLRLQDEISP